MSTPELLWEMIAWVTAAIALVSVAAWVARGTAAVTRHAAWRLALLLFWVVPAGVAVGSALELGVLPAGKAEAYDAVSFPPAPVAREVSLAPNKPAAVAKVGPAPLAERATLHRRPPAPVAETGRQMPLSPVGALLLLWAAGAGLALAICWRDLLAVRRLRRAAAAIGAAALPELVSEWKQRVGLGGTLQVMTCPEVAAPTVVGWRAPSLLLPPAFEADDPGCRAVLVHELAHVKERHNLLQLLARVTRAVWWWHPLAWVVARQVQVTAEEVCDDWAVALTGESEEYARHLVRWAEMGQLQGALAYSGCGQVLVRRVQRVLSQTETPRVRIPTPARLALILGAVALLGAAALLRAAPAQPVLHLVLRVEEAPPAQIQAVTRVLEDRVVGYGLSKPAVKTEAGGLITLDVQAKEPEADLRGQLKLLLTSTGELQIRAIPRVYGFGVEHVPEFDQVGGAHTFTTAEGKVVPTSQVLAESSVLATGADFRPTSEVITRTGQQGRPPEVMVTFELRDSAAGEMRAFTKSHIGTYVAFVLDDRIVSCPIIKDEVPGKGMILGGFGGSEGGTRAKQLSAFIKSGPLPVPVQWVEGGTTGPGATAATALPYTHFLFRRRKVGQDDEVLAIATVTATGVTVGELPFRGFDPFAVSGGRLYGFSAHGELVAVDLKASVMTKIGREEYIQNPTWVNGRLYFGRDGEIREYDLRGRAWRSLGKIPGRATDFMAKVSPDGRWLAFFTQLSEETNGPCQLHLLDLQTCGTRPLGQPMRYRDSIASSVFHFTPQFEWMDTYRVLILRSDDKPAGSDPMFGGNYLVTVTDAAAGTVRDITTVTWRFPGLETMPTWPQPLIKGLGSNARLRDTSEHAYVADGETMALKPAEFTAGDFRMVIEASSRKKSLFYSGRLLVSGYRWGLSPIVSPDHRYAVWEGEDESGEPGLCVFDSDSGKTHLVAQGHAIERATGTTLVWYCDADLEPASPAPPPAGWKAFQETPFGS